MTINLKAPPIPAEAKRVLVRSRGNVYQHFNGPYRQVWEVVDGQVVFYVLKEHGNTIVRFKP